MKSYLTCPHNNVQSFTEYCLDCGYNIWTTVEEYKESLKKQVESRGIYPEIKKLEEMLGIER